MQILRAVAVVCLMLPLCVPTVYAQSSCTVGTTQPETLAPGHAWPQGASVSVYISPGFSSPQQTAIQAAFNNWANTTGGVTFNFVSSPSVSGTPNTVGVYQGTPDAIGSGTRGQTTEYSNGTNTTYATTQLNTSITDNGALTQTMAHEIGHTFGLNDCASCTQGTSASDPGSTAMVTNVPGMNDNTAGRDGPSPCDTSAVKAYAGYTC